MDLTVFINFSRGLVELLVESVFFIIVFRRFLGLSCMLRGIVSKVGFLSKVWFVFTLVIFRSDAIFR